MHSRQLWPYKSKGFNALSRYGSPIFIFLFYFIYFFFIEDKIVTCFFGFFFIYHIPLFSFLYNKNV